MAMTTDDAEGDEVEMVCPECDDIVPSGAENCPIDNTHRSEFIPKPEYQSRWDDAEEPTLIEHNWGDDNDDE